MWIIGGEGSGYLNDAWYSSDGKNWTCATSNAAWPGRYSIQGVVYNNKLWIMGGSTLSKYYNDVWYSTDGEKWSQASPPAAGWGVRFGHRAVVYDKKLWVIGGTGDNLETNDVWYYEEPVGIGTSGTPASPEIGMMVNAVRASFSGSRMTIHYALHKAGNVRIGLYACNGREIRTLWSGVQDAGAHTLVWDGSGAGGERVGAGAHFVRLKTAAGTVCGKIVIGW